MDIYIHSSTYSFRQANTRPFEVDQETITVIRPNYTDKIPYELQEPNITPKYNTYKSPVHLRNIMSRNDNSGYMEKQKQIALKIIRIPKLTRQT